MRTADAAMIASLIFATIVGWALSRARHRGEVVSRRDYEAAVRAEHTRALLAFIQAEYRRQAERRRDQEQG